MARVKYTHNSFSIGVISKKVQGNTEFEGFNNSLVECVNFQIQQTGGVFKRGGTRFMGETKSGPVRLIPFNYSLEEQYICEFGDMYIRFYTKNGLLRDEQNKIVEVEGVPLDTVNKMKFFQEGNSLILITSSDLLALERTGAREFRKTLKPVEYALEPVTFMNTFKISLKPDKKQGDIVFTVVNSDDYDVKPDAVFRPVFHWEDLNHLLILTYKIPNPQSGYEEDRNIYFQITKVEEDTDGFRKITAKMKSKLSGGIKELPNLEPNSKWQIGAFNKSRGYPKAAALYEGRLFLANNLSYPTGIWGSALKFSDWSNFDMGPNDADAFQFKLQATQADEILWLASQNKLFAGSARGIYIAGSVTYNDEAVTPLTFRMRLLSAIGASELQPIVALDAVFFVDNSGRNVHEIRLASDTGNYTAGDISLLATDLTASGIKAHAWQQTPIKTYWCAVNDGFLCSLTYLKNNGILAWSKHEIGGKSVKVEDLCTMYGDTHDYLWLVVRREIGGKFKYYIEYMTPAYDPTTQEEFKQFYVDSGKRYQNKFKITNIERGAKGWYESHYSATLQLIINNNNSNVPFLRVIRKGGSFRTYNYRALFKEFDNTPWFTLTGRNGEESPEIKIGQDDLGFVEATVITRVSSSFKEIYCDTSTLAVGDYIWIEGQSKSQPRRVETKTSAYITVSATISPRFIGSRIYLQISHMDKNDHKFLRVILDTSQNKIPADARENLQVYLNKINGTTQLNGKRYKAIVGPETPTKTDLYLLDPVSGGYVVGDDFSPFDTVDVSGNCYIYFHRLTGLEHLIGQKVQLCIDGNTGGTVTVPDNGIIELDQPAMYVSVGYSIKSWLKTTPFAGGSAIGSSVGAVGGQKNMWMYLYNSLGGSYGTEKNRIYKIPYQSFISGFDKPKALITGLVQCPLINAADIYQRSIYVEHDDPLSFNILNITQDVSVSDA